MTHDCWTVADAVLRVSRRVLLRGKPGTGKTTAARTIGLDDGQKVYQITMTPETAMAEIRGHFIQKGGDFVWHDGPATMAWREGARLVINEIDEASEDVKTYLYAVMDDPEWAETTLPTGEVIRPKPGFQVVATMNGEMDDLPDALQDRLPVEIEINDLHPDALLALPEDLRASAKNTALAKSAERAISIRMWLEFARLRDKVDLEIAATAVFGNKAGAALEAMALASEASEDFLADGKAGSLGELKGYAKLVQKTYDRVHDAGPTTSDELTRWERTMEEAKTKGILLPTFARILSDPMSRLEITVENDLDGVEQVRSYTMDQLL